MLQVFDSVDTCEDTYIPYEKVKAKCYLEQQIYSILLNEFAFKSEWI